MCLRKKIPKSFWQVQWRKNSAGVSSAVKRRQDGCAKPAFVFCEQLKDTAIIIFFVADFVLPLFFSGFSKVNRSLTQRGTCRFHTTGNTFARQACASQIKDALLRMIYGCDAAPGAVGSWGAEGLMLAKGVAGGAVGRWLSDLSYRKTDL